MKLDAVAGVGNMLAPAVVGGGGCGGLLGAEVGEAGAGVLIDASLAAISSGVLGAEVLAAVGGCRQWMAGLVFVEATAQQTSISGVCVLNMCEPHEAPQAGVEGAVLCTCALEAWTHGCCTRCW